MVLEKLFETKDLMESHGLLFIYSIIVAIVSFITGYAFFPNNVSVAALGFITIAFTHFIHSIYRKYDNSPTDKRGLFRRYSMVIKAYIKIFLALVLVFAIVYAVLPQDARVVAFAEQIDTLQGVGELRANIVETAGNFAGNVPGSGAGVGLYIFLNNLEVLIAVLLLSFIYGAGAIFLIAYQSSIIGAIIGENIINLFGHYNNLGIYGQFVAVLHGSYMALGILPHGIFEITAYFISAIIGGIISASLVGHYIQTKELLSNTVKDVLILTGIAILFLIIGAIIETFILLG